jgi:hypothetical protein
MDGCLYCYPEADWERLVESRLAGLDPFSREGRMMNRFFLYQGRMAFAYAWFRYERLMIAARCLGAMDRLVEEATAFAKERVQSRPVDGSLLVAACCRRTKHKGRIDFCVSYARLAQRPHQSALTSVGKIAARLLLAPKGEPLLICDQALSSHSLSVHDPARVPTLLRLVSSCSQYRIPFEFAHLFQGRFAWLVHRFRTRLSSPSASCFCPPRCSAKLQELHRPHQAPRRSWGR